MKIYNANGQLLQEKNLGSLNIGGHQISISSKLSKASSFLLIDIVGEKDSETVKVIL